MKFRKQNAYLDTLLHKDGFGDVLECSVTRGKDVLFRVRGFNKDVSMSRLEAIKFAATLIQELMK